MPDAQLIGHVVVLATLATRGAGELALRRRYRTPASDHLAEVIELPTANTERCELCGAVLDDWECHIVHDDDCEGTGWCLCPEVCRDCCPEC